MTDRILHVLVIARDTSLHDEVQAALAELPDPGRFVMRAETDYRRGVEHAIDRTPQRRVP